MGCRFVLSYSPGDDQPRVIPNLLYPIQSLDRLSLTTWVWSQCLYPQSTVRTRVRRRPCRRCFACRGDSAGPLFLICFCFWRCRHSSVALHNRDHTCAVCIGTRSLEQRTALLVSPRSLFA